MARAAACGSERYRATRGVAQLARRKKAAVHHNASTGHANRRDLRNTHGHAVEVSLRPWLCCTCVLRLRLFHKQ